MSIRTTRVLLLAAALLGAGCSSSSDDDVAAPTTVPVTVTTLAADDCEEIGHDALAPLQAFIDQYEDLSPDEWNALEPPPDVAPAQDEMISIAQGAVDRGCDPAAMEELLQDGIDELEGDGEVGRAIAAALRGEGPLLGPPAPVPQTTVPRDTEPSTVAFRRGDDLRAILDQVAPGSTIEFGVGTYEFTDPIIVDVDVTFQGAGRDETLISSSAEGVAVAFVGPGGFAVHDMAIEHTGAKEASVLLAIEGPLRLTGAELRGGRLGDGETGGGHGLVMAYDPIDGFPERTQAEQSGEILVSDTRIVSNDAAGILLTGDARPRIEGSTIDGNDGCGVCFTSSSGGSIRDTLVRGNDIGVQVGDQATPTLEKVEIADSTSVGVSVDGSARVRVLGSWVHDSTDIGVQSTGTADVTIERTTVAQQQVGALATGSSTMRIAEGRLEAHGIAVQVGGAANVEVVDSTVLDSSAAAISYGEESTGEVSRNTIDRTPAIGVQVSGSATLEVTDNTITGAGEVGITYVEQSGGVTAGNEVTGRGVGIQVGGAASPTIDSNTITDATAVGILYGDTSSGLAIENTVDGAESVAVLLAGSSTPTVQSNTITDSGVGVVAREQAAGRITGNTVRGHTIGMQLIDEASSSVSDNRVTGNDEAGVVLGGATTASFTSNTITDNGNIGVQIGEGARPTITRNEIRGEGVYGVLFGGTAAGEVSGNVIVDHLFGVQLGDSAAPRLSDNLFQRIALTSIVYADTTGGRAAGNECPTDSLSGGITVAPGANPTIGVNPNCSVSRGEPATPPPSSVPPVTTTIPPASTTTLPPTPPVPTTVPAGCPATDGSSPQQRQFTAYPPMCINLSRTYTARIVTNLGALTIRLDPSRAPLTVNNFVTLARFHYFDGTECHRAIPDFVVQCGDPTATGTGGPGYTFADELPQAGQYQIGSLAMANSGANTNGSQFFIVTGPNGAALPPRYSLFGQVIDGLNTTLPLIDTFGNPNNNGVPPLAVIRIDSVTITES